MSDASTGTGAAREEFAGLGREQMHSALFAQMVLQQSNLAMMLLGKTPHPETGQPMRDLEAAKLFIDQLEMLEVKTKGNLYPQETALLKQSLMALRLAFVATVNAPEAPARTAESTAATAKESPPAAAENKTAPAESTSADSEEETQKRFSKKYSA
ncbi:MAG: DUF1844 domain-containing protein [Verrucomicrobia bacterium]|jgi:hypothetical protein|nr:DUF1844 domain-containing protein [Verrucomicrobiota bacterium]